VINARNTSLYQRVLPVNMSDGASEIRKLTLNPKRKWLVAYQRIRMILIGTGVMVVGALLLSALSAVGRGKFQFSIVGFFEAVGLAIFVFAVFPPLLVQLFKLPARFRAQKRSSKKRDK